MILTSGGNNVVVVLQASDVGKTLGIAQPALNQGFDRLRMQGPELLRHIAHLRQQIAVALQIGDAQHLQTGLARTQQFAGATDLQMLYGNVKSVLTVTHHLQAVFTGK